MCQEYCDGIDMDEDNGRDPDQMRDEAIDDFMFIENEEQAIEAIERHPSLIRYLPNKYNYVHQIIKLQSIGSALHKDAIYYHKKIEELKDYIRPSKGEVL